MLFADWYRTHGSDKDGWPHVTFCFDDGKTADESAKGIWQAGGALTYHYLYELTGDKKWLEPLKVIVDRTVDLLEKGDTESTGGASHHGMRGNDDFCSTVLLAAWEQFKDRKYLVRVRQEHQHADGAAARRRLLPRHGRRVHDRPGDAGRLAGPRALKGLVDESKLQPSLLKAADFGLTQQELPSTSPPVRRHVRPELVRRGPRPHPPAAPATARPSTAGWSPRSRCRTGRPVLEEPVEKIDITSTAMDKDERDKRPVASSG